MRFPRVNVTAKVGRVDRTAGSCSSRVESFSSAGMGGGTGLAEVQDTNLQFSYITKAGFVG